MKKVFVLDVGSGSITFASGTRSDGGVFCIDHFSRVGYGGFYRGEWTDASALSAAVSEAVSSSGFSGRIPVLHIGVPSGFTVYKINGCKTFFNSPKTVTPSVIDALYEEGDIFSGQGGAAPMTCSACGFTLDGGDYVSDPVGMRCSELSAHVTYAICDARFREIFSGIAAEIGAGATVFLPSFWAECVELIDESARLEGAAAADIGFSSLSCAAVKGGGFAAASETDTGEALLYISMAEELGVSYADAQAICAAYNPGVEDGACEIWKNGIRTEYDAAKVSSVVGRWLETVAEAVARCLVESGTSASRVYVTGEGALKIKGAVRMIGELLGIEAELAVPSAPMYAKPEYSSVFGTFAAADKLRKANSFINRLLNRFRR